MTTAQSRSATPSVVGFAPTKSINEFDPVLGWSKKKDTCVKRKTPEFKITFETNDEGTVVILDADTAAKLDAIFEKYVPRATEIDVEKWARRSLLHKIKDYAAYSINELL